MCLASLKVVSQCFSSAGFSLVTLYCGNERVIEVDHAVHGRRPPDNTLINYCDVLPTDCLSDVTGQYDWSACSGHRYCVHSLSSFNDTDHRDHHHHHQSCANDNKQRLIYLQVS